MLSKVLAKESCAKCRFCCSFRRQSLWETPLFPLDTVQRLEKEGISFQREEKENAGYGRMELEGNYKTNDPQEEAACLFLDPNRGCVLKEEDKPFDCKIWPLRIMKRKDGSFVIALTPTCPSINEKPLEEMKALVDSGLGEQIFQYAKEHPFIVKEYRADFPVLMEFEQSL